MLKQIVPGIVSPVHGIWEVEGTELHGQNRSFAWLSYLEIPLCGTVGQEPSSTHNTKTPSLSIGQLKNLSKLQHIVEVLVILNNVWSYLQVEEVLFFVHSENNST